MTRPSQTLIPGEPATIGATSLSPSDRLMGLSASLDPVVPVPFRPIRRSELIQEMPTFGPSRCLIRFETPAHGAYERLGLFQNLVC